jgi:hypothetical protein
MRDCAISPALEELDQQCPTLDGTVLSNRRLLEGRGLHTSDRTQAARDHDPPSQASFRLPASSKGHA